MRNSTPTGISPDLTPAEREFASGQLDAYNTGYAPPADTREISCAFHDATGHLMRACFGSTAWDRLHINVLWIHEEGRGGGAGSRLLGDAETKARDAGCRYITLHSFSFQAREFYERHGYRVIFEAPNFPPGHTQYPMRKDLDPITD